MINIIQSIRPRFCELIFAKQKLIELRTTIPNIKPPFKVYIYQTKTQWNFTVYPDIANSQGKVIGEYVCDKIYEYLYDEHIGYPTSAHEVDCNFHDCGEGYWITSEDFDKICLSQDELLSYGKGKTLYGYHITELKLYDKPKELFKFFKDGDCDGGPRCKRCPYFEKGNEVVGIEDDCMAPFDTTENIPILYPPQSWCYTKNNMSF